MNSKHINEIVRQAKKDVDSGRFDRKLRNPNRDKVVLLDRGSAGRWYRFGGGFHSSAGQQRRDHDWPEVGRAYEADDFGLMEKS